MRKLGSRVWELRRANEILKRAASFFEAELCATRCWCAVRRDELKEVEDLFAGLSQQVG